ncbi:MAG: ribonuclease R family protein, partial [Shimia sp.]
MARIPSRAEVLDWITQNPTLTSKRDIAKAFGLKGAARIDLKRILRELEDEGHLEKRKRSYRDPDSLPPVGVLTVAGPDADGDPMARPMEWKGKGPEPRILILTRDSDPALGEGDRVLAKLQKVQEEDVQYHARLIRKIGRTQRTVLGIYRAGSEGGRIEPIDKGAQTEWIVPAGATGGAQDGELVEGEQSGPKGRLGLPRARITDRLGDPTEPRAVSLIAIHQHGIPDVFPDDVLAQAAEAEEATLAGREDLRHLPLITIDPSDARDHDDAICAIPEGEGHVIWVAIADVAHYVPEGSALDREARKRGNSTYFPDRVVPMLPDRLSGDLCSLHEGVDRPCLAVRMVFDSGGHKTAHDFHRGIMRSPASLSYEEAQAACDGAPSDRVAPHLDGLLDLHRAWQALMRARAERQPLDLDLPERRIELDEDGTVQSVAFKDRLDAHRIVEECMIAANVAAAEELIARRSPLLFRVHEEPDPQKLDALRDTAESLGLTLAKGQVLQTRHLNRLLEQAAGMEEAELINLSTLRSMSQAYYSPENFGHFGLALANYAHFTSPIRRYSDLIVHRALIGAHGWGERFDPEDLDATAKHISETERRSMLAERDTTDRYLAAYLSERLGTEAEGRVSGIAR